MRYNLQFLWNHQMEYDETCIHSSSDDVILNSLLCIYIWMTFWGSCMVSRDFFQLEWLMFCLNSSRCYNTFLNVVLPFFCLTQIWHYMSNSVGVSTKVDVANSYPTSAPGLYSNFLVRSWLLIHSLVSICILLVNSVMNDILPDFLFFKNKRWGMIANETVIHQKPSNKQVNFNTSPHGLQWRAKPIP